MEDELVCPKCHKKNGIQKFCIYCGNRILDDNQFELMMDNPEPYCLNCGKTVKKDKRKCECGYEFMDIKCPECSAENSYSNKFCTSCGKKLWKSNIYDYVYRQRLFEHHILNEQLPYSLHTTSLYQRSKKGVGRNPEFSINIYASSLPSLEKLDLKINENLHEISSRWKIISPNYCLTCLNIIKPDEFSCSKCYSRFPPDKERVKTFQSENNYIQPLFDNVDLKWTSKNGESYKGSLAPSIGESQFEYRERLKWEFAENKYIKKIISNLISKKRREEERKRRQEEYTRQVVERRKRNEELIRQFGGGYCSLSCRYCYEEFFDSHGAIVGYLDSGGYYEYYCSLGHPVHLGSYCKDYE